MYLAIYIILTILVVALSSRKMSREGYLIAKRQLPPWASAISLVVSNFGGGKILGYGSLVYLLGPSVLWYYVGYTLGWLLFSSFAFRLKKQADQGNYYTMTDYYKANGAVGAQWTVGVLCVVTMLGFTCINIVGGAQILSELASIPYAFSVLFVSGFIGLYLLFGGFKSVVATDVLQGIVVFAGLVMFLFFASWPQDINFEAGTLIRDLGKVEILYIFVFGLLIPYGQPEVWPRIYAAKSLKDLKVSIPFTMTTFVVLGLLVSFIILGIRENFPGMPPTAAILTGFQSMLPVYFAGVMSVFLFAAIMSSADTYLYQATAALEQDLKWLDRWIPTDSIQMKMQISILFVLTIAIAVAFLLPDIIQIALLFTSAGFVLGIFGLLSTFITLSSVHLYAGTICGALTIIVSTSSFGISFYLPLVTALSALVAVLSVYLLMLALRNKSDVMKSN